MALETRLQMKLTQKLVMNQSLQLAIKLLQMNKMELETAINQELLENPVLEIVESDEQLEGTTDLSSRSSDFTPGASDENERPQTAEERRIDEIDWKALLEDSGSPGIGFSTREDREFVSSENFLPTQGPTLYEHLLWQLSLTKLDEEIRRVAVEIIGTVNDDGYLTTTLPEIAVRTGSQLELVEQALRVVQDLDPVGVASRDPRECLLLQVRGTHYEGTIVERIIADYLPHLERNAYPEIARLLGTTVEQVKSAVEEIQRLEPKPGRQYQPNKETQYITPDVYIVKVDGKYRIILNDDGIPRLRISQLYKHILNDDQGVESKTRKYVEKKCRNAVWLIRSIEQRQRTIYRVSESLLHFQRDFFDKGIAYLKPLVLKDVADEIGMSESTVSRVSTNKYMHTPQGLYEIKFFFHSGLDTAAGGAISSLRVKDMIKSLILNEDQKKPLSDSTISKELNRVGIRIKRRTVAKYRDELSIPAASRRKVY
ncbi:RNA polymerase factor sigma-54 [bacterium]|nr:RNA polymerase factor sigma-54 [candidate division CSSED10-310 bacterium]